MRSNSAGSMRCTPPPRTVAELAEERRRSASARDQAQPMIPSTSRPQSPSSRPQSPATNSRGVSPSRDTYQSLVKTTYFGFESNYPNESDVARREMVRLHRPPKILEKGLDPKALYHRGFVKCKHCSLLVPQLQFDEHQLSCALVPLQCPLVDTETGTACTAVCRGKELLREHTERCSFRTRKCENAGCGKLVSLQSTSLHLQSCSFEKTRCALCGVVFPRSEELQHQSLCPQQFVRCPLGCGEAMRRADVTAHVHNTLWSHRPKAVDPATRGPEDPECVIQVLLKKLIDMHDSASRRLANPSSRSTTPQPYRAGALTSFSRVEGDAAFGAATDGAPSTIADDDGVHSLAVDANEQKCSVIGAKVATAASSTATSRQITPQKAIACDAEESKRRSASNRSDFSSAASDASAPKSSHEPFVFQRPHLCQPVQSIAFARLHTFLKQELTWHLTQLNNMVPLLQTKGLVAELDGIDLAVTLSDVAHNMQWLLPYVDAFGSRTQFDGESKASCSTKQEEISSLWKKLDRVWYEWKLAMYEKMYME